MINTYSQLDLTNTQIPAQYNNKIEYGTDNDKVRICVFNGRLYVPTRSSVPSDKDPTDTNYWQPYTVSSVQFDVVFDSGSDFDRFADESNGINMEILSPTIVSLQLKGIGSKWEIDEASSTVTNANLMAVDNNTLSIQLEIKVTNGLINDREVRLNINKRVTDRYVINHHNPYNITNPRGLLSFLWRGSSPFAMSNNHGEARKLTLHQVKKGQSQRYTLTPMNGEGIDNECFGFPQDEYLRVTSPLNLVDKSFTIMWWAKTYTSGNNVYYFGSENSGITHHALHIGWRSANRFTLAFYSNDVDWTISQSSYIGKWTHYAISYEKNSNNAGDGVGRLYLNGLLQGSKTFSDPENFKGVLERMGRGYGARQAIDCLMSQIRIFTSDSNSFIIGSADIRKIYEAEKKFLREL